MQIHHDAAPARPTAESISRFAAGLLAAVPGMHPLDAVRLAMEATAGTDPGHERPLSSGVVPHPRTGAPTPSARRR